MTETKIQRKKQTLLWLLAGFVIAALLINFLIFRDKDNISKAEAINNEPFETSLAKNIRNATDNSTTAMQHILLAGYPWLTEEVDELLCKGF